MTLSRSVFHAILIIVRDARGSLLKLKSYWQLNKRMPIKIKILQQPQLLQRMLSKFSKRYLLWLLCREMSVRNANLDLC